jgi:hypothetical protein
LTTIELAPGEQQTCSPTAYDALRFGPHRVACWRYARSYRSRPSTRTRSPERSAARAADREAGRCRAELRAHLLARATWYQIDLKNEITSCCLRRRSARTSTLPPTKRWGWEFAVRWQPTPTFELRRGLNLLNAESGEARSAA